MTNHDENPNSLERAIAQAGGVIGIAAVAIAATNPALVVEAAFATPIAALVPHFLEKAQVFFRVKGAKAVARTQQLAFGHLPESQGAELAAFLENEDSLAMETLRAAAADDEAAKAWAFAGVLRAFHEGVIPEKHRVRWLRFVQECFHDDLVTLVRASEPVLWSYWCQSDSDLAARFEQHLKSFGIEDDREILIKLSKRWTNEVVAFNHHLRTKLREFGWIGSSDILPEGMLRWLLPVLRDAAHRAGVLEGLSELEFFELARSGISELEDR